MLGHDAKKLKMNCFPRRTRAMTDVTTSEPSVEDCLRELREILPLGAIEIRSSITEAGTTHIVIMSAYLPMVPYADTLSEAMSQVRAWHREQNGI
jgi:hypothetical protein